MAGVCAASPATDRHCLTARQWAGDFSATKMDSFVLLVKTWMSSMPYPKPWAPTVLPCNSKNQLPTSANTPLVFVGSFPHPSLLSSSFCSQWPKPSWTSSPPTKTSSSICQQMSFCLPFQAISSPVCVLTWSHPHLFQVLPLASLVLVPNQCSESVF